MNNDFLKTIKKIEKKFRVIVAIKKLKEEILLKKLI